MAIWQTARNTVASASPTGAGVAYRERWFVTIDRCLWKRLKVLFAVYSSATYAFSTDRIKPERDIH
jgi:hypothetical protein